MKNDNLSVTITLGDIVRVLTSPPLSYLEIAWAVTGDEPTLVEIDHVNKAIAKGIKAGKLEHISGAVRLAP